MLKEIYDSACKRHYEKEKLKQMKLHAPAALKDENKGKSLAECIRISSNTPDNQRSVFATITAILVFPELEAEKEALMVVEAKKNDWAFPGH